MTISWIIDPRWTPSFNVSFINPAFRRRPRGNEALVEDGGRKGGSTFRSAYHVKVKLSLEWLVLVLFVQCAAATIAARLPGLLSPPHNPLATIFPRVTLVLDSWIQTPHNRDVETMSSPR